MPKSQCPNPKQFANSKTLAKTEKAFGLWDLIFPWDLGFGFWDFRPARERE
jgi:hypothetical protein